MPSLSLGKHFLLCMFSPSYSWIFKYLEARGEWATLQRKLVRAKLVSEDKEELLHERDVLWRGDLGIFCKWLAGQTLCNWTKEFPICWQVYCRSLERSFTTAEDEVNNYGHVEVSPLVVCPTCGVVLSGCLVRLVAI